MSARLGAVARALTFGALCGGVAGIAVFLLLTAGDLLAVDRWAATLAVLAVFTVAVVFAFLGGRTDRRVQRALSRIAATAVLTPLGRQRDTDGGASRIGIGVNRPGGLMGLGGLDGLAMTVEALCETIGRERESLLLATSGADDGLFDIDLRRRRWLVSARARDLLAVPDMLTSADLLNGRSVLRGLMKSAPRADRAAFIRDIRNFLSPGGGVFEREMQLSGHFAAEDGRRWLRLRAAAFRDGDGRAWRIAGAVQDITSQKAAEAQRLRDAFIDPVTGLSNRVRFIEDLDALLSVDRLQNGSSLVFACLDLDRFRRVNDAFGQEAGDIALAEAGRRLAEEAGRSGAITGRLGGDLFGFAQMRPARPGVSGSPGMDDWDQEAAMLGERLVELFDTPFTVDRQSIHASVSVGVVVAVETHRGDDLLGEASQALAVAKSRGRSQVVVGRRDSTRPLMTDGTMLVLESDLRRAIGSDELAVVYQPIVSASSGALMGVEALVRWRHPVHGPIPPELFVGLAEETDIIVHLGRYVLDHALKDLSEWRRNSDSEEMFVAVNLSRRQLYYPLLMDDVLDAIARHGVPPGRLKLEITESLIMPEEDTVTQTLLALQKNGISLSIDDFGTGHSSLSVLARLPFDTLKIDRSFVADMHKGGLRAQSLVEGIVSLAHRVGMDVVVEGVETANEAEMMRAMGIAFCQGYYFGKPLEADVINDLCHRPSVAAGSGEIRNSAGR